MGALDNITFEGPNASELQAAYQYLYDKSPTFRSSLDTYVASPMSQSIVVTSVSAAELPGVQNVSPGGITDSAPGYNILIDGTIYLGVNFDVSATILGAGVPDGWTYRLGDPMSDADFINRLNDVGFIDPVEFFPDSDAFWQNNGQYIDGYDTWSQLPNLGLGELYDTYFKWAYQSSGASAAGVAFEDFPDSQFYFSWEESPAAFESLNYLRNDSIIIREMTIEERLGHEFAHTFIHGGLINEETQVIEYMNGVREDMGLPPIREGTGGSVSIQDMLSRLAKEGYSMPTVVQLLETLKKLCFGPEVPIDMWPLEPEFAPDPKNPCKQYDQDEVRAKIWKKPIELIEVGDWVVSHDKNGNLVPGYVPRTMTNDAKILLNFHGTRVTPGHVYYRPDSKRVSKYETLIDILRDDGVVEQQDGVQLRAATNAPVDGPLDGFVKAITGTLTSNGAVEVIDQGRIRLGTRFIVRNDEGYADYCVADLIAAAGGMVGEDELIRLEDGVAMPFHWEFGDVLPKPEDFVLACSGTSLVEIYKAAEWESQGPRLSAPTVLDGGPVKPLAGADYDGMPRNEPLTLKSLRTKETD
ncbi:hypothetical protein J7382_06725 [Shimia sp. R11_0]|uniref:hypothetical protein n=1 Tax=Shimia sp. R11_0 TaxID=2821096 RepID=UPI001ADA85CB|nr:hypothetical protein [Shimia sp. R11_0]MBO9477222.1 hypothetical protein [Shimia sp. R11_0]